MITLTFLGTSSMIPTKERNQSAVMIRYGSEGILIDCVEGTQMQMKIAGIPITKVTKILISHWHCDHTLRLPGVLQTLSASEHEKKLNLFGPIETEKRVRSLFGAFIFDSNLNLAIKEVSDGVIYDSDKFLILSAKLSHGVPTCGFSFVEKDRRRIDVKKAKKFGVTEGPHMGKLQNGESIVWNGKKISPDDVTYVVKGKKITYITDTVLCDACYNLANDSDILICEATYGDKLEKKSHSYGHMTAREAALIAKRANVRRLILTHFSARYKDANVLVSEAKEVFSDVVCAKDFMEIKL